MTRLEPPMPASRRRGLRRRDQSGAAIVEFALVVSLFMLVLYGLISYGMILATKQRVTNAASEAARSAVGQPDNDAAMSTALARVNSILADSVGKYTPVASTVACGTGTCVEVKITWDYLNNPVVPLAPGLGLVTPDEIVSKAQVQYK